METFKHALMIIGAIAVLWAVICAIVSYYIVYVRPSKYIRDLSEQDPEPQDSQHSVNGKKPDKFIW